MDPGLMFKKYNISESCHVDLISKLVYDIDNMGYRFNKCVLGNKTKIDCRSSILDIFVLLILVTFAVCGHALRNFVIYPRQCFPNNPEFFIDFLYFCIY
jgi:hypothetical protein